MRLSSDLSAVALASPAGLLLCQLEAAADALGVPLEATITSAGRVRLAPKEILTPALVADVQTHRDALALVVCQCDAGVDARRQAFARLLDAAHGCTLPALVMDRTIVPSAGTCFSCGDALRTARMGRCWRCAIAWRLAVGLEIPANLPEIRV